MALFLPVLRQLFPHAGHLDQSQENMLPVLYVALYASLGYSGGDGFIPISALGLGEFHTG